jgi:hypothetical protein
MPFPIPVTFFKAGTTTTTTTTTTTVAPLVIGVGYSASVLTPSRIQTSSNGTSWALQNTINSSCTSPSSTDTATTGGGVYAPSLGLYVITLGSGSVITSTTATTSSWTVRTTPYTGCGTAKYSFVMTWAASLGLFVGVHQSSANPITSPDGINWTSRTGAGTGWRFIVWAASISTFVAGQSDDTSKVLTSTDGITWTLRSVAGASKSFYSIAWSPSLALFVAVGDNVLQTSPDGITWTSRTAYNAEAWRTISWSPTLSLFVAGSDATRSKIISSPDGINWTERYVAPSNGYAEFGASVWSPALAMFIIAGYPGTRGFTSTNGTSWTERTFIDTLYCRTLFANS